MQKFLTTSLLLTALAFSGCASIATLEKQQAEIQAFLSTALPPDFVGDVHVAHFNPYFNIGFDAGNVHKNPAGLWTWDSFSYERADLFHTSGKVTLVPAKK